MNTGFVGVNRLLRDLRTDLSGNTMMIVAGAILPIAGMIGGGVDMSRAYMAKTQMQAACDAGVLAGRHAMSKSGAYGSSERSQADKMFNFNFGGDALGISDTSFTSDDNDEGQVIGTASGTLPTLVMKIFKFESFDLSVTCMAELQISNADVMFVLDNTGSMSGEMDGLRDAVRDFHMTINEAVKDDDTRIRYGFVPYSLTVNARGLVNDGDMPTGYFTDSTPYQTRVADFQTPTYIGTTDDPVVTYEEWGQELESGECNKFGRNDWPSNGPNPVTTGTAPSPTTNTAYSFHSWERTRKIKGKWHGTCFRRVTTAVTTYETKYAFTNWIYKKHPIDTSAFRGFASVPVATSIGSSAYVDVADDYDLVELAAMNGTTAQNIGTSNYSWNGCLEERDTVAEASFDPVPESAYDLNLTLEPSDNATRWKPQWWQLEYRRNTYEEEITTSNRLRPNGICPAPMMLFRDVELSDNPADIPEWLDTYLDNLVATGNTYHDVGMIWGGRLSSPSGIFADNVNEGDLRSVSRHIIFMTDGKMEPSLSAYSAYGMEEYDSRIAPENASLSTVTARHTKRFSAACEAIKAQGTTIWVIAFGTTMTTELQNCASGGRSYYSSNTEQLRNTFRFIASQVADLRLGQ